MMRGTRKPDTTRLTGRAAPLSLTVLAAAVAAVGTACDDSGEDRILEVEAEGRVQGFAFLDANGSGALEAGSDDPFPDLGIRLVLAGTGRVVETATTDDQGAYAFADVPVGRYRVQVDSATVGDTVGIVFEDSVDVTLALADTAVVRFGLAYPTLTAEEIRGTAPGSRAFIEGIALSARNPFGDASLHLRDSTGAIRATRVGQQQILAGDTIRLLGTISRDAGQPVLDAVTPFVLAVGTAPEPEEISTAAAAAAGDGRLDAALVRIRDATVLDSATVDLDFRATVDDGSGPVTLFLDGDIAFDRTRFEADATVVRADGLLVPTGEEGVWRLQPTTPARVVVEPPPPSSVGDATGPRRVSVMPRTWPRPDIGRTREGQVLHPRKGRNPLLRRGLPPSGSIDLRGVDRASFPERGRVSSPALPDRDGRIDAGGDP